MLSVKGLCFSYPQRDLFNAFSVDFPVGLSLIQGNDGCGKTTLLRLIAGDLSAESGDFIVNGISLKACRAQYQQQVFWADPLTDRFDPLNLHDYFDTLRAQHPGFAPAQAPELARLIAGFGLSEHQHKPIYMLSTGSKRKVWLTAALLMPASVILLDLPFAALDRPSIAFAQQQIKQAASLRQSAWLLTSYDDLGELVPVTVVQLPDES